MVGRCPGSDVDYFGLEMVTRIVLLAAYRLFQSRYIVAVAATVKTASLA